MHSCWWDTFSFNQKVLIIFLFVTKRYLLWVIIGITLPCWTDSNEYQQCRLLLPHPLLIFSQSDYLIQIADINSHGKQCRFRSVGFWRSQLIWTYTVCNCRVYSDSNEHQNVWFLCRNKKYIYLDTSFIWRNKKCQYAVLITYPQPRFPCKVNDCLLINHLVS